MTNDQGTNLLVVIININNFNGIFLEKNKKRPVFPGNSKAPNSHFSWFKEFCFQSWIKRVSFKKFLLFFKSFFKISFLKIFYNLWMKRKNFHFLKLVAFILSESKKIALILFLIFQEISDCKVLSFQRSG